MKSLILVSLFTSFTCTVGGAAAPAMRESATHEQLVVKYRQASQAEPVGKAPVKGKDSSTASPPKSLIGESDIICFNGTVALIPKRAILQMPKNMAERFVYKPGAKLLGWADFYALHRGWITTIEVSRIQAEGNSPLAEETKKKMVKSGNLIIATYQAAPISVLPLKKAPAETTTPAPKS